MNEKMSVDTARELAGAETDYRLAKLLGVTRQAVGFWRKRGHIGFKYPDEVRRIGAERGKAA